MTTLEHAQVYIDLPKNMQDEDALSFARAVVSLYAILDKLRPVVEAAKTWRARQGDGTDSPLAAAVDALIGEIVTEAPREEVRS